MIGRRLLLAAIMMPLAAIGQAPEGANHVTRLLRFPASTLLKPSEIGGEKSGIIRNLPATSTGRRRCDIWPYLVSVGVPDTKGARAVLFESHDAVVVSAPAGSMDAIERALDVPGLISASRILESTVELWEYEDDPLSPAPAFRFADLQKAAGPSLRLLDSRTFTQKPGNIAWSVSDEGPRTGAKKPAKPAATPEVHNDIGTLVKLEPAIRLDVATIDFDIKYESRIKRGKDLPEVRVSFSTHGAVRDGQSVSVYNSLLRDGAQPAVGKVKRAAVFIRMRVLDPEGNTDVELTAQWKKEKGDMLTQAFEGLGGAK